MKRGVLVLPLLAALDAGPAQAVRPSYSYLEGAYVQSEVDDSPIEAQGPRAALSVALSRGFYFTGEYDQQKFDNSDNKISASSAGFGIHGVSRGFQLFLAGSYERLDFNDDDAARDAKDEGFGGQLGFRLPLGLVELGGDAEYLQIGPSGDDRDEWRYRGTLQAYMTPNIAAVFGYETFDRANVDQVTGGLRVYFNSGNDRPQRRKRAPRAR